MWISKHLSRLLCVLGGNAGSSTVCCLAGSGTGD